MKQKIIYALDKWLIISKYQTIDSFRNLFIPSCIQYFTRNIFQISLWL
jgi:hypothetical protein